MTFSPLVSRTYTMLEPNYSTRPGKVTRLIVHHTTGGTETYLIDLFRQSKEHGRSASVNYLLTRDGRLIGLLSEKYRPWTSGSATADNPSVTVEVMTFAKDGYTATEAQLRMLARLTADLADRHGWGGTITRNHVRGHREFASTSCPGDWLWARRDQIIADANTIRAKKETPVTIPTALTSTLKRGSTGPEVTLLQQMLNGLRAAGLDTDGRFGPATEAAVVAAHKAWNSTATPTETGPAFRAYINKAWANRATPAPANPYAGLTDRQLLERIAVKIEGA